MAVAMPLVVGAGGLAVETSFDYVSRSRLQSAADAAAYAAGIENMMGSSADTIRAAATQQAAANGWSAVGGTLVLSTPPASGPNAGAANAVEVRLTGNAPRFFTAYFSAQPITMTARAVSLSISAANACILALNKTASQAIQVQGNSTMTLTGCDVMSNSIANDAINVWGSSHLTADCAVSVGGVTNHGGLNMTGCAAPITQAPRAADPFASLPTPTPGAVRSIPNGNGPVSLQPGSYPSGMNLSGDVTLSPGVYYVSGGNLKVDANANISGSGVTIFLASGSQVSMNGNATVNMSAPTSGTYSGILFFGDRNATSGSNTFNGTASSHLTGDIYFPTQQVSYLGNYSGQNGCTQIIADTVSWSGNTTMAVDCAAMGMTAIPARQAVKLVE